MKEYHVVVGAGPAGHVAATRTSQLGLKAAIVENQYWGGICPEDWLYPVKSPLRNAELAHIFTHEAKLKGCREVSPRILLKYMSQ